MAGDTGDLSPGDQAKLLTLFAKDTAMAEMFLLVQDNDTIKLPFLRGLLAQH